MDFNALMALFGGGSPQMQMQPDLPSAQPLSSMPGGLSSSNVANLPNMGGGPSMGQKLGSAFGGGWSQPTGSGLSAYHQAQPAHSGLAALLQSLGLM